MHYLDGHLDQLFTEDYIEIIETGTLKICFLSMPIPLFAAAFAMLAGTISDVMTESMGNGSLDCPQKTARFPSMPDRQISPSVCVKALVRSGLITESPMSSGSALMSVKTAGRRFLMFSMTVLSGVANTTPSTISFSSRRFRKPC